ncbi:MAG TPA: hypothetical protein VJ436_10365 [Anaerolineales bacterium]|nr:hypothetical protein [Anaerolineales bacterium]
MAYHRDGEQSEGSLSWLEYLLILILIIIVLAIVVELFGPFLKLELARLCLENGLPCDFLQ